MKLEVDGTLRLIPMPEQTITSMLNMLSAIKGQLARIEAKLDLLKAVPGIDPAALAKLEADLNAQIDADTAKMKAAIQT
jgi:hypothetical protein